MKLFRLLLSSDLSRPAQWARNAWMVFVVVPGSVVMMVGLALLCMGPRGLQHTLVEERARYSTFDFAAHPDAVPVCEPVELVDPSAATEIECKYVAAPIDVLAMQRYQFRVQALLSGWLFSMLFYFMWRYWLGEDRFAKASGVVQFANTKQLDSLNLREMVAPVIRVLESADPKAKILAAHTTGSRGIMIAIQADLACGNALTRTCLEHTAPYCWTTSGFYVDFNNDSPSLDRMTWILEPNDVKLNAERATFDLDEPTLCAQFERMARTVAQHLATREAATRASLTSLA